MAETHSVDGPQKRTTSSESFASRHSKKDEDEEGL